MEYLYVVGVNLVVILAICILDTVKTKHSKRKNMVATSILLATNLVFNIACLVYFVCFGLYEPCKIMVLFLPLTAWLLYEAIKEVKTS